MYPCISMIAQMYQRLGRLLLNQVTQGLHNIWAFHLFEAYFHKLGYKVKLDHTYMDLDLDHSSHIINTLHTLDQENWFFRKEYVFLMSITNSNLALGSLPYHATQNPMINVVSTNGKLVFMRNTLCSWVWSWIASTPFDESNPYEFKSY